MRNVDSASPPRIDEGRGERLPPRPTVSHAMMETSYRLLTAMEQVRRLSHAAYEEELCVACEPALRDKLIIRANALRGDIDTLLRRMGANIIR